MPRLHALFHSPPPVCHPCQTSGFPARSPSDPARNGPKHSLRRRILDSLRCQNKTPAGQNRSHRKHGAWTHSHPCSGQADPPHQNRPFLSGSRFHHSCNGQKHNAPIRMSLYRRTGPACRLSLLPPILPTQPDSPPSDRNLPSPRQNLLNPDLPDRILLRRHPYQDDFRPDPDRLPQSDSHIHHTDRPFQHNRKHLSYRNPPRPDNVRRSSSLPRYSCIPQRNNRSSPVRYACPLRPDKPPLSGALPNHSFLKKQRNLFRSGPAVRSRPDSIP